MILSLTQLTRPLKISKIKALSLKKKPKFRIKISIWKIIRKNLTQVSGLVLWRCFSKDSWIIAEIKKRSSMKSLCLPSSFWSVLELDKWHQCGVLTPGFKICQDSPNPNTYNLILSRLKETLTYRSLLTIYPNQRVQSLLLTLTPGDRKTSMSLGWLCSNLELISLNHLLCTVLISSMKLTATLSSIKWWHLSIWHHKTLQASTHSLSMSLSWKWQPMTLISSLNWGQHLTHQLTAKGIESESCQLV